MRNIIITCFIFANFGLITQSWSQEHVNHTGEIQSSEDRHSGHKKTFDKCLDQPYRYFCGYKKWEARVI